MRSRLLYVDDRHHAEVLVGDDMAVVHVPAEEVHEPHADDDLALDGQRHHVGPAAGLERPPVHGDHLEVVDVDVERVQL